MIFTKEFWIHTLKDAVTSFVAVIATFAANADLQGGVTWGVLIAVALGAGSAALQSVGRDVQGGLGG